MKKIGISFILLNIAVVLGSAAIISGIGFAGVEGSFLFCCALVAVTYVPLCLYTNIENNKITDWIVARTVEKNIPKHNFENPYTIYVNNATLMLDIEGGRIAYISNLNPWKFQLIYAKDIDDIKKDYKNLLNTTNYVYFQFSYHGKVTKFPTFVSRELRSIETDVVQKALKKANICIDVLNAAKYGTLDNKKFGCENKDLQGRLIMDIYIEKEKGEITLQEWLDYVKSDDELILAEVAEGINPLTKQKLRIEIPGRVVFKNSEINFRRGRIGSEDGSEEMVAKLKEIATVFGAEFFE